MEDDKNLKQPTAEELQEEEIALKDSKEDEIRNSVIEKYGLSDDDNKELIDKLTKDIIAQRKSFGKVVAQKRSWREQVLGNKPPEQKKDDKNLTPEEIKKQAEEAVEERFMNRDLEDLDASDTLKEEVKKLAKLKGLSIRQAFKDPYIQFLHSEEVKAKKMDKSIIAGKKNGEAKVIDPDAKLDPSDFDLSTKEGREAWDKAKKAKNSK